MLFRKSSGLKAVLALAGLLIFFWRFGNGFYLINDGSGHLAYLPNLILSGNLDFSAWMRSAGVAPLWVTNTGLIANPWGCGPALLWLPFFMAGVALLAFLKIPLLSAHLYPLFYFTNAGTMIYVAIALALTVYILKKVGLNREGQWLTVTAFLGTPLFYYATYGASMSHGVSAFSLCLFTWVCMSRPKPGRKISYWFLVGMLSGLLILIRTEMAGYLVLLMLPLSEKDEAPHPVIHIFALAAAFVLGLVFVLSSQLLIWKVEFGKALAFPQAFNVEDRRFVLDEVIFSPLHGLLYWNPLILLGLFGYFYLPVSASRKLLTLMGVGLLIQVAILSFKPAWSNGYSFGNRLLANSFLPITLGLTCPLLSLRKGTLRSTVWTLYGFCALWTLGLHINHIAMRLNLGILYLPQELFTLQFGLIRHPLRTLSEIIHPDPLFWKGFFGLCGLTSLSFVALWAGSRFLRKYWFEALLAVLAIHVGVFLVLSARAAWHTQGVHYTVNESAGMAPFRIWAEYSAIQTRIYQVNYLVRMGKREQAQRLLDETVTRLGTTEAWNYLEKQAGGSLHVDEFTLDRIGAARPG